MKNSTKPRPPAHLSEAAKRWWKAITTEYEFDAPDSVMTLETVMECFDRATAARQMVEKDGAVIRDRFNQLKQHPATIIERDAKMAMLRALKALGLDVVAPGPIGRLPGR